MTESIVNLAEDYLEARSEVQSDSRGDNTLREEREKWKSKMDELEEDDPLYEIAKENYEEKDEKLDRSQRKEERFAELERNLLNSIVDGFLPRGDWTNQIVLRAINLVLLDSDRDHIEVGTTRIEEGTEVENDKEVFDIAMAIRAVAMEEVNASNQLQEFWNDFADESLNKFKFFKEIAQSEKPLTGSDIAKRRAEEDKRQSISQTLTNTTKGKFNPYYTKEGGEYSISFVGEYLVDSFWNGNGNEESDDDGDSSLNNFQD